MGQFHGARGGVLRPSVRAFLGAVRVFEDRRGEKHSFWGARGTLSNFDEIQPKHARAFGIGGGGGGAVFQHCALCLFHGGELLLAEDFRAAAGHDEQVDDGLRCRGRVGRGVGVCECLFCLFCCVSCVVLLSSVRYLSTHTCIVKKG